MNEASKPTVNGNKPSKNKNQNFKGNKPITNKTKTYHSKTYGKKADISMIEMQPLKTRTEGEQARVFNNDTQKSMCVSNKAGTSDSQISTVSDTVSVSSLSSTKSVRRKQNRANKRRNLAKQDKSRKESKHVEQTDKLDNLKSLIDVLALTIESQVYSITSLNKFWEKYSSGTNVICPCGKRHYPFNKFCDLELQVMCTYNFLIDLLELSEPTPQDSDCMDTEAKASNDKKVVSKTDNKSLPFPSLNFSISTDEESSEGRPECVYDVVSCGTPPDGINAPQSKKKVAAYAEQLIKKLNEISASDMGVEAKVSTKGVEAKVSTKDTSIEVKSNSAKKLKKITMADDKDMGQYSAGNGTVRRVKPEIAEALAKINETYTGKIDKKNLKTPISRPVIDNIAMPKELSADEQNRLEIQEMENPKVEEYIPGGFKLQYKPAFWQFWRHKSTFNSEAQFNHDAHFVRRVAKSKNLDHTNLPDECVIDSLYSYLVRRRLPTYPSYNAKLEHLHKLAKAWESESMPLSKNIANASQLNNYYLTIGKVANSTDIDMLLSQHHEDNLGRRARFIRWITGRTVQTVRED